MRIFLLSLFLLLFLGTFSAQAQPVLSVSIDFPSVQVDQNTQSYTPMPLEVTATIYNTGSSASQSLTARVSLSPGLELDSAELSTSIKTPVPAAIPAGDSAKVKWNITYPAAFSAKNYRIYVWVKYSASDSLTTSALLTVPPIPPPNLMLTPTGIPALTVRADSLGYDGNPFAVNVRFSNAGGTTADSVTVELRLPPDYELDPPTQENPIRLAQPLDPQAQGGQRLYLTWTVRYTAATRAARSDTLHIVARGKDIAGGTAESEVPTAVEVPGMNPVFAISFMGPGALDYDTAAIYRPLPYPLIMRLTNDSEQWTLLGSVLLSILGDGWTSTDPFSQTLPALAPGGYLEFTWRLNVERRRVPRQLQATVEVTDAEGYGQGYVRGVSVPGKAYDLTIQDLQLPDSLERSPDGTQLLTKRIPISFRAQNDTWYNSTLVHARIQTQGEGVGSPPWTEHALSSFMLPGEKSIVVEDTFTVAAALKDRTVTLHVLAVSDRGDTARSSGPVRIPGLQPVLALTRRGADALAYLPGGTYTPNPFFEEYVLHNRGHVTVRVDSVLLRYPMDGVSTPQALRRDVGFDLAPGDSMITRWDFTAYVRDTLRRLPMHVTAYVSREYAVAIEHTLEIPPLFPVLTAVVDGPDTLAYDPDSLYAPNPFTRTLRIHNTGMADLHLDSVLVEWNDALLHATTPVAWNAGAIIAPDSVLQLPFTFRAEAHDSEQLVSLVFTLYHAAGKEDPVGAMVYIPALRPGLDATVLGNAQLVLDPITVYRPDPFLKTVRIGNSGTADLQVDSITVSVTDPRITVVEGRLQTVNTIVSPASSHEVDWHFNAAPHLSAGYVVIRFTLYHSGGEALPLQTEIFVPGEPFDFTLENLELPDRLVSRTDGQGYVGNPVVVGFQAENDAWFASTLRHVRIRVEGDGVDMLTQQPRDPAIDLNPHARSVVVRDSFFVFPAAYDRVIRVYVQIQSSRGLGDSTWQDIFVPKVSTTAVAVVPRAEQAAILGVYPNPVTTGRSDVLHAAVRSPAAFRWEVYDMLGRRLTASAALAPAVDMRVERIPLNGLPEGNYLLRILNATSQVATRFVILK